MKFVKLLILFSLVFAVVSFIFFFISLVLFWKNYKKSLNEAEQDSFIDGFVNSLVHTYFYGYLKKIIPDQGTEAGGLFDRIKLYKERQNLTDKDFPLHKIFILICASGYVPPTLEKIDHKRIEARQHLPPSHFNRAGTKGRTYRISVYKIKYRNLKDHVTVAMEGVPSLLTVGYATADFPEIKRNKEQIIKLFYKKLSEKLAENAEFANYYELLFYNDDPNKPPTLADEIIQRHIDLETQVGMDYPSRSTDSGNGASQLH